MYASPAVTSWRLYSERVTAAAVAVLLQAGLYSLLTPRHPSPTSAANEPALVAMVLTAVRSKRERPPPLHASERLVPVPVTQRATERMVAPAEPERHASRPGIDWQGALRGEVRAELSRLHAPPKLRFGFPQMPAEEGPAPAFGWNDARINRVQRLAHGLFDLSDHCFIKLWPPIPQCHFEPANGGLFEHMHDPRPPEGPNSLP